MGLDFAYSTYLVDLVRILIKQIAFIVCPLVVEYL